MMDYPKFKALICKILLPAYRARKFNLEEHEILSWYAEFQDFDELPVMEAIQGWVRTQSYPPTVADLRKEVGMLVQRRPQDYEMRSLPDLKEREAKQMPQHIKEKMNEILKKWVPPNPAEFRKPPSLKAGDLREYLREKSMQMTQDYCRRTYNPDGSMKSTEVVDEKRLEIAGKPCKVLKFANGTEAVVGLTEVMSDY